MLSRGSFFWIGSRGYQPLRTSPEAVKGPGGLGSAFLLSKALKRE